MTITFFDQELTAAKQYWDGTHRVRSPADTLGDYGQLRSRIGITRIGNVTGLDYIGIPVYVAFRPNARSLVTSQGKGLNPDAARASALMESIEAWHAEHVELPMRWESYQALQGSEPIVDIDRMARKRHVRHDWPRAWTRGFDLLGNRPVWVPLEAVSMNYVDGGDDDFSRTSNGVASGNHLLEAIVHGICEVIERDAESLWRRQTDLRLLHLSCVQDAYCRRLIDTIEQAGVFVAAWDITSDLGIPAYGALVMNPPDRNLWRVLGVHYGFGCHLHPGVALARAICEAAQTRLTYISGSRDDLLPRDYEQAAHGDLLCAIYEELTSIDRSAQLTDHPSLAAPTFDRDVEVLLSALAAAGIEEVAVVDLSKPEIGVPVVRVAIPGMEAPDDSLPGERATRIMTETET